jgi:hypothetical protein
MKAVDGGGDHLKKTSLPEVVGIAALVAGWKIKEDRPDVHIQFHRLGYHAPPGHNGHRVRVILVADHGTTVAQTPCVGLMFPICIKSLYCKKYNK